MKATIITIITALTISIAAQTPEAITTGVKNYEKALKSDNSGVVECAVFHIAKLKLLYPGQDTESAARQVERLAEKAANDTIRYKAYLALQLLTHTERFSELEKRDYKDAEEFFLMLGNELQKQLIVTR